jgi:hypothetical protein
MNYVVFGGMKKEQISLLIEGEKLENLGGYLNGD